MPRRRPAVLALALLAAALVAGACSAPPPFDPSGPCTADGSAPGAYPDLEAQIPTTFEGQAPETLDSGRNCTVENLGVLADAGIDEVRFAGGAWDFGANRAAALVVFEAPGLTRDLIADFYTESAKLANRTDITGESSPTLAGQSTRRLDSKTGERIQTIVVWPGDEPDTVHVVITNDLPDPKIEAGVAAFGDS